jgi:hypothetical protein
MILDRLILTEPWKTTDDLLENLIDKEVLVRNPQVLDDDLEDIMNDWGERIEAIDAIIYKLEAIKKELQ